MNRRVLLPLVWVSVAVSQAAAAEQGVLKMGANDWKFLDTAEAPAKEWNTVDFDDSQWKSGQAPLGYGDDDIKQTISFGEDDGNKNICAFFRRTVEVQDPKAAKQYIGNLVCDDGCVVYLNGEEVHRFNLPDGELKNDTKAKFAVGGDIERHAFTFLVDAAKFKPGKNVIAARVHQVSGASSDVAFDLSLTGLDDDAAIETAKRTHDTEQTQIKSAIEQFSNQ